MALDTAKTNSTTTSQAIKNRYYVQEFLKNAEVNFVHKQLGQMNRKVEQGQGGYGTGVTYWTKWVRLPAVSAGQGEGFATTAIVLSAQNVTGSTAQYDQAVSISDIIAYTSFGDVMKAAIGELAYSASLSIDTVVRNEVANSGTAQIAASAASVSAIPSTAYLLLNEVRKAVRTLDRNNARRLGDGYYVAVAHPDSVFDLMGDTSTGGWIDANKYTDGNAEKLLKGEVGKLYGVRFLQTTNGYANAVSSITGSGTVQHTSFFGSDAFGITELQNLKTYVKGFGSGGTGDPTEKIATAGWKTTFGAAMLNSTWAVNVKHMVSGTA